MAVYTCRVSSVLSGDTRQFGKQHLLDASEETCWHSDALPAADGDQQQQAAVNWIEIAFREPVRVRQVNLMFQVRVPESMSRYDADRCGMHA